MSGKPTVATVPPGATERLAAMGCGLKVSSFFIPPSALALSKARSLAASTLTTSAEIITARIITQRFRSRGLSIQFWWKV
jgi:hypothetical protein